MERSVIAAIAARDVRSGVRNRWFMLYAIVFIMLSVGFSMLAMGGSTLTGQPGFGRTAAGLLNLMLLMVPLIPVAPLPQVDAPVLLDQTSLFTT